jgi:hypothetical protein
MGGSQATVMRMGRYIFSGDYWLLGAGLYHSLHARRRAFSRDQDLKLGARLPLVIFQHFTFKAKTHGRQKTTLGRPGEQHRPYPY